MFSYFDVSHRSRAGARSSSHRGQQLTPARGEAKRSMCTKMSRRPKQGLERFVLFEPGDVSPESGLTQGGIGLGIFI
jgi:hypothetical protein